MPWRCTLLFMGRSVQFIFQTENNINGTTNFLNLIQGFFTFTCYGLTSASPGKSQNSTFCCHSLFRVLRSDCNGELQILLLCKPRKSLVGHAFIVRVEFYNHQQYWKSSTTQKKKILIVVHAANPVQHVFTGDIIWPWQQITLFQSYNTLKYIDLSWKYHP